jgi:predicted enzyme related to lactoylglutathione lyase
VEVVFMLGQTPVSATVPCSDFGRAKKFYGEQLGLKILNDSEGAAVFECGGGTRLVVYPTRGAGESWHTLATFETSDLAKEMAELRDRGITFEEYDFPGIKTVDGVAVDPDGGKAAWFKDSEGNTIGLVQM